MRTAPILNYGKEYSANNFLFIAIIEAPLDPKNANYQKITEYYKGNVDTPTRLVEMLSMLKAAQEKKPEIFTALDFEGVAIERGTDPKAA